MTDILAKSAAKTFAIPAELTPSAERQLPELTYQTLVSLREAGWKTLGIMTALQADDSGEIAMLRHHGRTKNNAGALGPLGETSRSHGFAIEQPLTTFHRGLQEETGIARPEELGLKMAPAGGWEINQWPKGLAYPGQYACAIAFAATMPGDLLRALASKTIDNHETQGITLMHPDHIVGADPSGFRDGVHNWLQQILGAGLLDQSRELVAVDFSSVEDSGWHDIDLQAL